MLLRPSVRRRRDHRLAAFVLRPSSFQSLDRPPAEMMMGEWGALCLVLARLHGPELAASVSGHGSLRIYRGNYRKVQHTAQPSYNKYKDRAPCP